MPLSRPALWARIASARIGPDDVPLTFTTRLARENGWTAAEAEAAIEAYRRFVYLCLVADRPMTPPAAVDQVWHLHLTYTRAYWHDLCRDTLGRPLHHEPTAGGPDQRAHFAATYRATLETYEREFDAPPPAAAWPDVATRFAGVGAQRWVDGREHWVIDRRALRRGVRVAGALLGSAALAACTLVEVRDEGWRLTEAGVWLAALLVGLPLIVATQWSFLNPNRRRRRDGEGGIEIDLDGDGGCSGCSGCSD